MSEEEIFRRIVNRHNSFPHVELDLQRGVKQIRKQDFPDYPTNTTVVQELVWDVVTCLSGGQGAYSSDDLTFIFETGYTPTLFGRREVNNTKLIEVAGYVFPRLVRKEDTHLLADAEVHFTDSAQSFYSSKYGEEVLAFRPNKRGRIYRVDYDQGKKPHITFLLRHPVKDNYTDAFELVSFLSFVEFFKRRIMSDNYGSKIRDSSFVNSLVLLKGIKSLGLRDKDDLLDWASRRWFDIDAGLKLTSSTLFELLPPWRISYENKKDSIEKASNRRRDPISDAVLQIKKRLEKPGRETPDYLLMGNDFSVPLLVTLGFFSEVEIDYVLDNADQSELNRAHLEQEIKKLPVADRDILRRFAVHQYLNTYRGDDPIMSQLQTDLQTNIETFRTRLIHPTFTALGDVVDLIDFSLIPDPIIEKIPHEQIKEIIRKLKNSNFRFLSVPYPLGDSVYGFVKAVKEELRITNIGFFGKVGAVIGEKVIGPKRGRVVLPEHYSRIGDIQDQREKERYRGFYDFNNVISAKDTIIIPEPDTVEAILVSDSLLLQTFQDIDYFRGFLIDAGVKYPAMLLDMESYYLQLACRELGIKPAIIYYVSDNTRISGETDDAITKRLGTEGTIAAIETPLTILNRWLQDLD